MVGALSVLAIGCAEPVDDAFPSPNSGRDAGRDAAIRSIDVVIPDGGLVTAGGETCGNGLDDNHDGRTDEGCLCNTGRTQRCFVGDPSHAGVGTCTWGEQTCMGNGEFGTWTHCMGSVDSPTCDGDGGTDDDGGVPIGVGEVDGGEVDAGRQPNCRCIPGHSRYCDTPVGCSWGIQFCRPDSTWGPCNETNNVPEACKEFNPFPGLIGYIYRTECCVSQGLCCQNYPRDDSVGQCRGIVTCE